MVIICTNLKLIIITLKVSNIKDVLKFEPMKNIGKILYDLDNGL